MTKELVSKLRKIFPIKKYRPGISIEEIAVSSGEQNVIDKIESMTGLNSMLVRKV